MKSFVEMLQESFVNLVGSTPEVIQKKEEYAQEVLDILNYSYRNIGGIKGSGFNSIQDMIKNVPFWKLVRKDGKVHAVVMYKDNQGRKAVQLGVQENSRFGRVKILEILKNDIFRSYAEVSGGVLATIVKSTPWDILKAFTMTPQEAHKILGDEVKAITDLPPKDVPQEAQEAIKKYPFLKEYQYIRELNSGATVFKVMFGTQGKKII